ncbi:MAG: lysine exporter LysO family protein [Firmicutes bacterium]|nr:lysine exporter LysO family protein [Dethiobacter sp.]MBS3887885.1 lysine exporter LysO family protein [Bacillota bacterium]MBS4053704.1 lysine exporter LysO family protein [Thermaerobacter sp.]
MTRLLLGATVVGGLLGRFLLPSTVTANLSQYAFWLLLLVLFGIGIELGSSDSLGKRLLGIKPKHLLLPVTSALGTLLGAGLAALLLGVRLPLGLGIGAGFGWYSLSSIILAELAGAEIAAIAFLTNVIRELISIPLIPKLFRHNFGPAAITPGGATTMDTTLAVVSRAADQEMTLLAFYHGVVLSTLSPILVTLLGSR